ncbi:MAG: hypothetical protein LUG61_07640 [Lachnospiraceae bacterium]|nr:hypothetical protein [Lachnospiraceae bacterium]
MSDSVLQASLICGILDKTIVCCFYLPTAFDRASAQRQLEGGQMKQRELPQNKAYLENTIPIKKNLRS